MATSRMAGDKDAVREPQASRETENSMTTGAVTAGPEGQKAKKAGKRPTRIKPRYTKFARLENRQKAIEQNRRAVYAHLDEITRENIKLAKKGNSAIAKFLFEFAGINQVPAMVKASSKSKKAVTVGEEKGDDDPTKAVLSFYKKLGIEPPKLKPPKAVEAEGDEQPAAS